MHALHFYRLTLVLHYSVFVCVENVVHFPVLAVYAHCCDINVLPRLVYKPTTLIHSSTTVTYQHCLPTLLFHDIDIFAQAHNNVSRV